MVVDTVMTQPEGPYPTIFRTYIIRSTKFILQKIRQFGGKLATRDRKQALHTLSYALNLDDAWPDTRHLLLLLAPKMEQAGYRDEWIPYLERGINQCQKRADTDVEAELHLQLGVLYQLRSKYQQAYEYLSISANQFEQAGNRSGYVRALNQLAYVARLQRNFEEAISLVQKAKEALGKEDSEPAFGNFVLGLVALDQRDWTEAIDFSTKAYHQWQKENDLRMMGRCLMCRGVALEKMKDYNKAIEVHKHAIALFEKTGDILYQAASQMNLGNVYISLKQYHQALALYRPAERTFRQMRDQFRLALVNHNMGMTHRRLQNWAEAKFAFLSSIELWQHIGNVAQYINAMDGLGLVYFDEGDYEKAKVTFEIAFDQLIHLKEEAAHNHWHQILTNHLLDVSNKI